METKSSRGWAVGWVLNGSGISEGGVGDKASAGGLSMEVCGQPGELEHGV